MKVSIAFIANMTSDNMNVFQTIFLDLTTLLQCLKIAEHSHFTPPISSEWWLDIVKRYPVEINLDGRIQTESE